MALSSVEVLPVDGRPSEPDGFREFVETRSSALLRSGWLLTGDWPSAEDLVQTALAAAWPRWATLTRQDAPELYVRKIMVNTFLRWRRRRWTGCRPDSGPWSCSATSPIRPKRRPRTRWAARSAR